MNLKLLRKRVDLRTIDVALRLGTSESTVRNWEKGRSIPKLSPVQICQILELYKCTAEEFRDAFLETRQEVAEA